MFMQRRPNFDRADDENKPWAKTGAWFLGPKADNKKVFKELINDAVEKHVLFRERYRSLVTVTKEAKIIVRNVSRCTFNF